MFCILCLCIILCDTSKASENLTFETKSHSVECFAVVIICRHYLGAMNIKDSVDVPEEMCKF